MIVVHHLNNSRSQRVLWLLEELELDYRIERYQRDPKTMLAPAGLRRVHPLGKSPVLEEDGRVYAESGAILEHVVDRHGGGRLRPPAGSEAADRYRFWMHYAEGSAMPPLLLALIFAKVRSAPMPFFARPIARGIADKVTQAFIAPNLRTHFDFVEAELGRSEWFAGDQFSAADIQMSFPAEAASVRAGATPRPRMAAFLERIHARPAYQRALERGGPFVLG